MVQEAASPAPSWAQSTPVPLSPHSEIPTLPSPLPMPLAQPLPAVLGWDGMSTGWHKLPCGIADS